MLVSELAVDGRTIPTVAFRPGARAVRPVMRDGREPASDHEVALGSSTMRTTRSRPRRHGAAGTEGVEPARVVGTVVMPAVGTYHGADKAGLGEGMLVTPHALTTLGPDVRHHALARSLSRRARA